MAILIIKIALFIRVDFVYAIECVLIIYGGEGEANEVDRCLIFYINHGEKLKMRKI